ncbi:HD domain-containing protein [Actinophytocola oryzae]|uniref:HD domain-containing protein n=1 Tax=Actinophytocola oryzae TaxID=502181 RepID=UPI001FB8DA22|nr:HD domain-containing protein [Actinophytocola oryzae]
MEEPLLVERRPLPVEGRLGRQLAFIVEVDRLKTVLRASTLAADARRENDAEHSWHLALMVPVLAEYADEPVDVGHTIKLVVVHDLVEIYAGDTPLYDDEARVSQEERELAAAERLFGLLPDDQAVEFRALWDEFEARRTPEARFAKAVDRLEPNLLNWMAGGGTWGTPGVTGDTVRARTAHIGDASHALGEVMVSLIDSAERNGWIAAGQQGVVGPA